MAKIYFRLIEQRKMSIEEVPQRWRAAVQVLLNAHTAEKAANLPLQQKETGVDE